MKVLHINAVYGVGSTGTIVADIHELSLAAGIDSYVAYSTSPKAACDIVNGYRIGGSIGKKMHALFSRINGKHGYFSRYSTRALCRHIDTVKPDIVHLHNLHSNYIHLNMLLKHLAKRDISTVVTLHDCWFYTGGCFHYTNAGCDRFTKGCGACPKKKQDTPAYLFDCSARILRDRERYFRAINELKLVGVSQWIAEEAQKGIFRGAESHVIYVIYNGVDSEVFYPEKTDLKERLGIADKYMVLGMANKWLASVNAETLKTVMQGLPEDAVLVIAGCTESQIQDLPEGVIGIKHIRSRDEMRALYGAADVFVNCTREESMSLVNVEAQACGTPVITYRNTGAAETVDGECSFSVETGNAEALFEAVLSVKEKGKAVYSQKCVSRVRALFDKNENYKKYIEMYRKDR